MSWNYRVTHRSGMLGDEFEIREVYYKNGTDEVHSWSALGITPFGDTADGLREDLNHMLEALDKPVINLDEMEARDSYNGAERRAK